MLFVGNGKQELPTCNVEKVLEDCGGRFYSYISATNNTSERRRCQRPVAVDFRSW